MSSRTGCVSSYPLASALFGRPFLWFCRRTSPQVPPDAAANQEEGEPRRRGHEHLNDLLDPIRLPKRRDGEREYEDRAQSREDRSHRHYANPYHQTQAPRTQHAPLSTRLPQFRSSPDTILPNSDEAGNLPLRCLPQPTVAG